MILVQICNCVINLLNAFYSQVISWLFATLTEVELSNLRGQIQYSTWDIIQIPSLCSLKLRRFAMHMFMSHIFKLSSTLGTIPNWYPELVGCARYGINVWWVIKLATTAKILHLNWCKFFDQFAICYFNKRNLSVSWFIAVNYLTLAPL